MVNNANPAKDTPNPNENKAPEQENGTQANGQQDQGFDIETITANIRKKFEEEYGGIKGNRDDILAQLKEAKKEKQELSNKLAELDSEDNKTAIEFMREMREKAQNEEEKKLFDENRHEEVFQRRTERLNADYKKRNEEKDKRIKSLEDEVNSLRLEKRNQKIEKQITDTFFSKEIGGLQSASSDFITSLMPYIELDDDGKVTIYKDKFNRGVDSVEYGIDGNPMSIAEFVKSQKQKKPYFFQQSTGGSLNGSGAKKSITNNPFDPANPNRAEQTKIINRDRAEAWKLAQQAGVGERWRQRLSPN